MGKKFKVKFWINLFLGFFCGLGTGFATCVLLERFEHEEGWLLAQILISKQQKLSV